MSNSLRMLKCTKCRRYLTAAAFQFHLMNLPASNKHPLQTAPLNTDPNQITSMKAKPFFLNFNPAHLSYIQDKKIFSFDPFEPRQTLSEAKIRKQDLGNTSANHIFFALWNSQVEFKIEVASGPSTRAIALELAEYLKETWVILDR